MAWELYQSSHRGLGTLCEVYTDEPLQRIKRVFKPGALTVSGEPTRFSEKTINMFFENEVYWLKRLRGEWLPELIEINPTEKFIIQEMPDLNLLEYKPEIFKKIPDICEQVVEMYRFFKTEKVFKRNGSLSNLTQRNGQILAFDFKWAMPRPLGLDKELYTYDNYLNKIHSELPLKLRELL